MMGYEFGTTPDPYQQKVFTESWDREAWGLFLEMGLGKTKIAIDTACALFEAGRIGAVLVIAPKGVLPVWVGPDGELARHTPARIPTAVAHWRASMSAADAKRLESVMVSQAGVLSVFVVNYDALSTPRGYREVERFVVAHKERGVLAVLDESTAIKNPDAKRTKAIQRLKKHCRYRRIATGAPVTRNPLDVWSQIAFLEDNPLGSSSYYGFRAKYAVMARRTNQGRQFHQVVGFRHLDDLQSRLKKISTRLLKADCLDLPDKIYLRRDVEMTEVQRRLYDQVKRTAVAELEGAEGDPTGWKTLSAPLVITRILRLHQIACGIFTPDDEKEPVELPSHRMDALCEVVEESAGKVIIWANYRANIHAIEAELERRYGAGTVVTYYGDTPFAARQEAVTNFQDPDHRVRFFLGHPKTGGSGLTLTQGTTVVYFSNSHDLDLRGQSEDRSHRRGQRQAVTYVDLVAPGTVDEVILRSLRQKIDLSAAVLGDGWREWVV